jgi:ribosome-binding factor A
MSIDKLRKELETRLNRLIEDEETNESRIKIARDKELATVYIKFQSQIDEFKKEIGEKRKKFYPRFVFKIKLPSFSSSFALF